MAKATGRHDSGGTSSSTKSGYGGKHSTEKPTTPRTDLSPLSKGDPKRATGGK